MPRIPPSVLATLRRPPPLPVIHAFRQLSRPLTHSPSLSLLPALLRSRTPALPQFTPLQAQLSVRFATFGSEYQPSQRKRKRRHGFLARKRSVGGRKILRRRMAKGRKYLSH